MVRLIWALCACCIFSASTTAEEADQPIGPTEWREMTRGQTVYYFIDGQFFGREYYWPGRDHVTFQFASGACSDARWDYRDGTYCFHFSSTHCFAHVRRGDDIIIIPAEPDESGTITEQTVSEIITAPFSCNPGLSS